MLLFIFIGQLPIFACVTRGVEEPTSCTKKGKNVKYFWVLKCFCFSRKPLFQAEFFTDGWITYHHPLRNWGPGSNGTVNRLKGSAKTYQQRLEPSSWALLLEKQLHMSASRAMSLSKSDTIWSSAASLQYGTCSAYSPEARRRVSYGGKQYLWMFSRARFLGSPQNSEKIVR